MKEIAKNTDLIAYCGLYCGACKSYLMEKCPGCHETQKLPGARFVHATLSTGTKAARIAVNFPIPVNVRNSTISCQRSLPFSWALTARHA